ncbi:MAG: cellulase family glycosylhydrolase [Chloroflexi bacterium]|nr:cellulase family glycosylhydrolase [Chloroflexota bacterium]
MIRLQDTRFVDDLGRTLLLRGVNLGGSSKVPFSPDGASWRKKGFFQHREVSFVGRPFPLEEADEHFTRLKAWGMDFLRFLVTWEAVEHAGPGQYDEAYLDYVRAVVEKAADYEINLFIDPHQDVWSRFTGGDGAPGWTLEAVGLDMARFSACGAAITHQEHGDPLPGMIWPTNYGKLANLTMWTLFFGGNDFAPNLKIEGQSAQDYLQGHYIEAMRQVAARLKGLPNVAGFDTLNEPSAGLIGCRDLNQRMGLGFLQGEAPSAFEAMRAGAGLPTEVELWQLAASGPKRAGKTLINPDGVSAWREGMEPLWKAQGVWGVNAEGQPEILKPDYFARVGEREVDFYRDYFRPFANRYAAAIRAELPDAILFVEGVPLEVHMAWTPADAQGVVHAIHWYDNYTLFTKSFSRLHSYDIQSGRIVVGMQKTQAMRNRQVAASIHTAEENMGGVPTLIGEVGIPFDMNGKRAYRTGNLAVQTRAMDATMRALEANLASFTLWNYTADNTNERGDQWNDEDLSIFSRDQMTGSGSIHDGGRALRAVVRPYARKVPGKPLQMAFDWLSRHFDFEFIPDPAVDAPLEVFVPELQYPTGGEVITSAGRHELDLEAQVLRFWPQAGSETAFVRILPHD